MNLELMNNEQMTITSVELVEVINDFRRIEGNKSVLQHKTFLEKIRKEVDILESLGIICKQNFLPTSYIDSQSKKRPCYLLSASAMRMMLNSESTLVRYKTEEYISRIETQNKKLQQNISTLVKKEVLKAMKNIQNLPTKYEINAYMTYNEKDIETIINSTISKGTLRVTPQGIAVDRYVLYAEALKYKIDKMKLRRILFETNRIIDKNIKVNGKQRKAIIFI